MLSPTPYPLWVSITLSPKSGGDSSGIVESNPDGRIRDDKCSPLLPYARLRPPRLALGQTEPKCRERNRADRRERASLALVCSSCAHLSATFSVPASNEPIKHHPNDPTRDPLSHNLRDLDNVDTHTSHESIAPNAKLKSCDRRYMLTSSLANKLIRVLRRVDEAAIVELDLVGRHHTRRHVLIAVH